MGMDNKKNNSSKSNSKFIQIIILLAICLFLILSLIKEVVSRFRETDESSQESIFMKKLSNKTFEIPTSVNKTDCEKFLDELEKRKIAPPAPFAKNQNSKKIAETFNEGLQFVFFRMKMMSREIVENSKDPSFYCWKKKKLRWFNSFYL